MGDRRVLQNSVPEIENVRTAGECVKDSAHGQVQLFAAGNHREWVEVALNGQIGWELLRCPNRIDRLIEADRVHCGFAGVSGELAASALGKADDGDVRAPLTQLRHNSDR